MKGLLSIFCWLETAGLGMWVGGMAALVLIAPMVFDTVKPVEMAGETMSRVFRNFNGLLAYIYIGMIAAGFLGRLFLNPGRKVSRSVEAGLLAVLILSGLYIGAVLGPRMQELRQIRAADPLNKVAAVEFDRDHRVSERLFVINALLGLTALFMVSREIVGSDKNKEGAS
ncbi:MAG: DUF4149 domain-containing protein [Nitrospirae bacterium]|nr:DUF4149 domain-containing protein [Nitrospirota bacterium]